MTTKLTDHQSVIAAYLDLGITNIGAGKGVDIPIPVNALLLRITPVTLVAFDSATTDTLTVSDGTTTFVAATDEKSAGLETATVVPKFYPSGGTLSATLAETGATATVGRVQVVAEYVILGRGGYSSF